MSGKLMVAIDGSEQGWKALDLAAELARGREAEVVAVHAVAYEPLPTGLAEFAKVEGIQIEEERARFHDSRTMGDALTTEATKRLRQKGVGRARAMVVEGNPAHAILSAAADEAVDMIVIGSRGHGDVASMRLGSVSHKVAHLPKCTCVIVK